MYKPYPELQVSQCIMALLKNFRGEGGTWTVLFILKYIDTINV